MIKKLSFLAILLFAFLLFGCSHKETGFLEYQSKSFNAEAVLEISSKEYSVSIRREENGDTALTFLSPSEISGASVKKTGDKLWFSVGDVSIPLKSTSNITAQALKLFELSKNELTYSNAALLNGVKVNVAEFECDFGKVTLYLSTDTELPVMIESVIKGTELSLSFSEFTVNQNNS